MRKRITGSFTLTGEQQRFIDISHNHIETGDGHIAFIGRAGSAKTTSFILLSEFEQKHNYPEDIDIAYLAFNKNIAAEAKGLFPANTDVRTTHSAAFREYVQQIKAQGDIKRYFDNKAVARCVDSIAWRNEFSLDPFHTYGLIKDCIRGFCQSDAPVPEPWHLSGKSVERTLSKLAIGKRAPNYEAAAKSLRGYVVRAARMFWVAAMTGAAGWTHDLYLKKFQLEGKQIPADAILLDEAQDLAGVQQAIVANQECPTILVGDSEQNIYEWRSANDAMMRNPVGTLTTTFRFGQQIAHNANLVLKALGASKLITPAGPEFQAWAEGDPLTILCRTNAGVVEESVLGVEQGMKVKVVGSMEATVELIGAVYKFSMGEPVFHPDVTGVKSFTELEEAAEVEADVELKRAVRIVKENGAQTPKLLNALQEATDSRLPEGEADLLVCTCHAAKGREWDHVRISDDFEPSKKDFSPEELRLLYVTATRGKLSLTPNKVVEDRLKFVSNPQGVDPALEPANDPDPPWEDDPEVAYLLS